MRNGTYNFFVNGYSEEVLQLQDAIRGYQNLYIGAMMTLVLSLIVI